MPSTQEWIDELKSISVLELSERIKALEEQFGVSAAAVAAAAPAAGAGAADEDGGAAEEQTAFDVVLTGPGDKKIQVIKVVRAATGLGLSGVAAAAGTGRRRSRHGGRGDAELLLEGLDALGELEHGDRLELLDPVLGAGGHV